MYSSIILNAYLVALTVVGLFSIEAAYLIFHYLRQKKDAGLNIDPDYAPIVTIQLPVYNELYVAKRLIQSVGQLDYPKDKLEIQVLDDSTDQTTEICKKQVAILNEKGIDATYIHRTIRTGYKAGALRHGLEQAKGDLVAIFDADFTPEPHFLKRTVKYFSDSSIGMVQTRWEHMNEDYSLLTKAQAFGLAGHFIIEQNGRNSAGYFINFNGTAGVWRKDCIRDAGNWQDDTLTEDLDLSYRAQLKGWKFLFLNDVSTPSELPAEVNALKSQQFRWTKGAIETAIKILPKVWTSSLPLKLKWHSTFHLTNNMVYPFILLLGILNTPLIFIKNEVHDQGVYFFIFSFFLVSFGVSFLFYSLAQRGIYSDWKQRMVMFPLFMSGSMGFSINNSRAVFEALLRRKSPFIRTPKYKLSGKSGAIRGKVYHMALDKTVVFELIMAVYSLFGLMVALYYWELGIVPFMFMFFCGYSLVGYMSIKHYFNK